MKNFQEKKTWRRIMQAWPVLMCLGMLVILFAWSVFKFMGKAEEAAKNKRLAQEKIIELQNEKEKLSTDIDSLQTPAGKEEAIREKFGWTKEGEGLVVVVDDSTPNESQKKDSGFFSFFKSWFK